jgi:hypothetical protein
VPAATSTKPAATADKAKTRNGKSDAPVRTRQATDEERQPGAKIELGKAEPLKPIAEVVSLIRRGHEAVREGALNMREHAIETGGWLLHAKARVKAVGQKWIPWVREHEKDLGFGEDTAEVYMKLWKNRAEIRACSDSVSIRAALRAITPPDRPTRGKKQKPWWEQDPWPMRRGCRSSSRRPSNS